MDVSAQTIRQVEFREKLRGYHQDDVDEFLERVAAGIEILQERLRQATERAVRAEQAATGSREDDESLRRTLVLAQRTADLAVKEAREQAARVVEEAEGEASAMLAAAGEECRRQAEEAEAQVRTDVARLEAARSQLEQDVDRLVRYLDEQRARVKAALAEAARGLDTALSAQPAPQPAGEADPDQLEYGESGPGHGAGTYDPSGQGGYPYS
ncbi:MAG: DivIVA domain-containing protein [Actinomycetota bacterium]